MFGFGKKKIKVSFYQVNETAPFAQSDIPVDQLPDTFEIDTTLTLGLEEWRVVSAQPARKADFKQTGTLDVVLTKPDFMLADSSDILFSLPTISDDMPALVDATSLENIRVLHEDDWRQIEFVSHAFNREIDAELTAITAIHEARGDGPGFREIHVRSAIPQPLAGVGLTMDRLKSHFATEHAFAGVAFNSAAATIAGGFAFTTASGSLFWGQQADDGSILFLNLRHAGDGDNAQIAQFLEAEALFIVDWPRCIAAGRDRAPLSAIFA